MNGSKFPDAFVDWARHERSIHALNLIGSRVRPSGRVDAADVHSDWDFQIVVDRPALFANRGWTRMAGLPPPLAYVVRSGRLGSTGKVSVVFQEGAMDLVVIPAFSLRLAKWLYGIGLIGCSARAQLGLADLALVLRGGHRLLKGEAAWGRFFGRVQSIMPPSRISDVEVVCIANGYVCDFVSTQQKIARGEFLAAQRWLHSQLAETNFRLLHEHRQRAGETSFPDARRIELVRFDDRWVAAVTVQALPESQSLTDAVELSAQTCCDLVTALVGSKWRWPEQLPLRLRGK